MKFGAVALLSAAFLGFIQLAGCTKATQSSLSGVGSANQWTVHGLLRMAGRPEPDNLNGLTGTQSIDTDLTMFYGARLFDWSDEDRFVPELATTVPTLSNGGISQDGLTITYHLRRGVTWQDGQPFGADDVIYTWRQVMNPGNFVPSRLGYELINRIDKPDDYTLHVHLKRRFAPFLATFFTMSNTSYCILPKHLLARYPNVNHVPYNNQPIGTGPFRVVSYEKGSLVRFVANPHYWRGAPKLKQIDYHIVPSDNTLLTQVRTHEIDFYYRASEGQVPSLRGIPGTRLLISPFTRFADIGLNAGNPALHDVRVRQALAHATDRREIIAKVTHGVDMEADSDQPPFFWAHDAGVKRYPFDPARAEQLLDQAGWRVGSRGIRYKDGAPLQLTMVGFAGSSTAAAVQEVIQRQWRDVGVDVSIKNYSSALLYAPLGDGGIEQSGKFDAVFEEWANGTDPDESILFRCDMAPPAGWNIYHFCSHTLDAAEQTGQTRYEQSKRKAAYATVQRVVANQLPMIVVWFLRRADVINTDLKNYRPARAVTPFWNTWEWSI
ncbi:MAG: peptide ABC transporter substrate-binding protein [Candidatus Eremiobacteraeota bacterium]|nr:peptide ABC transporter substrate-binding protein [Candidatus Eremiobacteraeota bacterium]MBC5828477.1 peptide ABC transporter substrate-binding protein [Candidatus Eremiobacteraeota bacterium]